jgi:hypothetical protein
MGLRDRAVNGVVEPLACTWIAATRKTFKLIDKNKKVHTLIDRITSIRNAIHAKATVPSKPRVYAISSRRRCC